MKLVSGTRLGRYEIRHRIGAGGMGEVYLAWDPELEREVAIKVLRADRDESAERTRRFVEMTQCTTRALGIEGSRFRLSLATGERPS